MTKRTILMLVPAILSTVVVLAAQQSSPRPPRITAPSGLTSSRTWTDDDIDRIMKAVGLGAENLQKMIDAKEAPAAEAQADTLEYYFDEVEAFFDARKIADAEEFAELASDQANEVEDALEANDFAKANENLKVLTTTCENCHSKFRERLPDGSYRIRKQ